LGRRPYKTTDGGGIWIEQTNLDYYLTRDVYFKDYNIGWLVLDIGGNDLFKTIDSGVSWFPVSEVFNAFRFHYFPDPQHWLINGGNRYITEDGGNMFIDITNDVPFGFGSFGAVTDNLSYASGIMGLILRYDDTSYVPVELINFSAVYITNKIHLHWITATETNNYGVEILRSENREIWTNIGFIKGQGTTTERNYYSFIDERIYGNKIFYKLKQIDFDGGFNFSEIITVELPLKNFSLSQNYPNPTNPITNISFTIPQRSFVRINLYSVNGELVKQLIEEEKEKGIYKLQIDLSSLPSGVYFYRMITNSGYQSTKKLIILK
jgi:hypothetical protein